MGLLMLKHIRLLGKRLLALGEAALEWLPKLVGLRNVLLKVDLKRKGFLAELADKVALSSMTQHVSLHFGLVCGLVEATAVFADHHLLG
jgi:hypothetical protein